MLQLFIAYWGAAYIRDFILEISLLTEVQLILETLRYFDVLIQLE